MFSRLNSFGKNLTYANMIARITRGKESCGKLAVWTHTDPYLFTQVIKNAFSDSVFDVVLADKQYVIYNSHKSYAYMLMYRFNRDRFVNSYHHNKRRFLKDDV